jgi:hypothetical protein
MTSMSAMRSVRKTFPRTSIIVANEDRDSRSLERGSGTREGEGGEDKCGEAGVHPVNIGGGERLRWWVGGD